MDRYNKIEIILGRFFLVIIFFFIGFYCVELIVRHSRPENYSEYYLFNRGNPFRLRPYIMYTFNAINNADYNALGYPGALPARLKNSNEYRIFVLGGSTVQHGPPTLPEALQNEMLSLRGRNIQVYNFGVGSSIMRQDVLRIMNDMAPYRPDLVVHYAGGNEIAPNVLDPRINFPHRFYLSEVNPLDTLEGADFKFIESALLSSQIVRSYFPWILEKMLLEPYLSVFKRNIPKDSEYTDLKVRSILENIKWGHMLAQDVGAKYMFVLQPMLAYKKEFVGSEVNSQLQNPYTHAAEIRKKLLAGAKQLSPEILFFDLSQIFYESKEEIYSDPIHFKDTNNNYLIAKEIKKIIEKKKLLLKSNTQLDEWTNELDYAWWLTTQ